MLISGQNLNSLADEVFGVTAVTMPRNQPIALAAFTSGTLYAQLITLPPSTVVNNLDFWMVGASTTPAHQWMALLAAAGVSIGAGTVLAVTADNVAGQAANTYYRAPVTAPFATPAGAPTQYYIGLMLAATTPGTVAGGQNVPAIGTFAGGSFSLAKFITGGAGLTTPPAVGSNLTYTAAAGTSANIYAATA